MSRFHSYIRTAQQMLAAYDGNLPFAPFAKAFFAREKKYGSTDRRQISALCYHYFRAAKALGKMPEEEKFITATFLCETQPSKLLEQLKPEWNAAVHLPVEEKIAMLPVSFNVQQLFPFEKYLSKEIAADEFALSFLVQPNLYLRVRPGYKQAVVKKLKEKNIPVITVENNCLTLPNGSKVDDILAINKEAIVQDNSSQQTGVVMQSVAFDHLPKINCWDCCAASGGKSLMLRDLRPDATLTVSDIRPSILHNLQQRFRQAGISQYQSFVADVSASGFHLPGTNGFNLIVADVPCTGSGTWARTPEQLYFFTAEKIQEYASRQQKIAANVLPYLQSGGYFVYITCSVFFAENEAVVENLMQGNNLQLCTLQYLKGYSHKADTLFVAVLQKQ